MTSSPSFARLLYAAAFALTFAGTGHCAPIDHSAPTTTLGSPDAARLGRRIFFDASLSASGKLSCASCHDPGNAYAAPNGRDVQLGGADLHQPGLRAVPSLRYTLRRTPVWSKEFQADPIEAMLELDSTPVGGFDWDGRFDTLHDQAQAALMSANQGANESPAAFAARLAETDYAGDFGSTFGVDVRREPERTLKLAAMALERFELEDASFQPYTSRFDAYLDGKVRLSPHELNGLKLFVAADKGNCASCHPAATGADGSHPLFTDFGFQTLGVPRNPSIPANRNASFFDLGLCGPLRGDLDTERDYCGMFKTPSLRNVATRRIFFHNGSIKSLRDAVRFYATRDQESDRWGAADLPVELRPNVDHFNAPFNRADRRGPALSDAEISDVVAFLETLTDGDAAVPTGAGL